MLYLAAGLSGWRLKTIRFHFSERTSRLLVTIAAGLLGNLLAFLSSLLTPLNPQVSFDFSHLATFAIAITFGPLYGALAAAIASIYPYVNLAIYGIYGPFAGLAIILGKCMTGFFCGLLRGRMPAFLAINLSYIPESLFTLGFLQLMSVILPAGTLTWTAIIEGVIMEGWVEVIMFSFIIDTVVRRRVIETAVLMLEIFIIMFLVHKEFIHTLLILLLITLITLVLFELVMPILHREKDKQPPSPE
jgi:hypothetical protein